jgi:hypothetical protein
VSCEKKLDSLGVPTLDVTSDGQEVKEREELAHKYSRRDTVSIEEVENHCPSMLCCCVDGSGSELRI